VRPPLPLTSMPADARQAAALGLHRELIALRRDRPWLTGATLGGIEVSGRRLSYTVGDPESGARLVVTLDISGAAGPEPGRGRPIAAGAGWSVCAPG